MFVLINAGLIWRLHMLKLVLALKRYTCSRASSRHVTASLDNIPHRGAFLLSHAVGSLGNIARVLDLVPWPAFRRPIFGSSAAATQLIAVM